jgi:hypothetical protein
VDVPGERRVRNVFLWAGWLHFSYSGEFPDLSAYSFYFSSPIHFLEHAFAFSPVALVLVGIAFIGVNVLFWWLPFFIARFLSLRVKYAIGLFGVLVFCAVFWLTKIAGQSLLNNGGRLSACTLLKWLSGCKSWIIPMIPQQPASNWIKSSELLLN